MDPALKHNEGAPPGSEGWAREREARARFYAESVQRAVLSIDPQVQQDFVQSLLAARQIVVAGRGRSGMMASAFARRLGQMGLATWALDDSTVPRLGEHDALVAVTGSGTTPTVLSLMHTARQGGSRVLVVTRKPARTFDVADVTVELNVPMGGERFPLGTLFEVSALAFLDEASVDMIQRLGATEHDLGARHTNLE
ncbi:MAG: 6-phospho-3-hexuloisomerase [Planctomycetota bacterium]|nr:MAG: 6-phospho-3-hexuloisomerase [Planctomycetota bacterium]